MVVTENFTHKGKLDRYVHLQCISFMVKDMLVHSIVTRMPYHSLEKGPEQVSIT